MCFFKNLTVTYLFVFPCRNYNSVPATQAYITQFRIISAGFTYRLYRFKPRTSRSKGASNELVRIVSGRYMNI